MEGALVWWLIIILFLSACGSAPVSRVVLRNEMFERREIEIPEPVEDVYLEVEEQVETVPIMSSEGRYVFLTFDDGPSGNTPYLLDTMQRYGVLGTFFFQGSSLATDSGPFLEEILELGHYIGLHSMTHHPYLLYWQYGAYRVFYEEMREVQALIYELNGHRSDLVRPPFGSAGTFTYGHVRAMADSEFRVWDWNVDSRDWWHQSIGGIMEEITSTMTNLGYPPLAVVLFHEHDLTVQVLPDVITYFMELGYEFLPYHPQNHFMMNFWDHPDL